MIAKLVSFIQEVGSEILIFLNTHQLCSVITYLPILFYFIFILLFLNFFPFVFVCICVMSFSGSFVILFRFELIKTEINITKKE